MVYFYLTYQENMQQTFLQKKYIPFFKGTCFKSILALILVSGNFCLSQNLINNKFHLIEKSNHQHLFDMNKFGDEYKESRNRTTFFAGLGTLISIPQTVTRKSYYLLSLSADLNFKIYKLFFVNTGVDIHGAKSNGLLAFQFNLLPNIGFKINNINLFAGFGGTIVIDPGESNGVGAGLKAFLKSDFYINDNYNLGFEFKHILSDYDFSRDFFINIGVTINLY